MNENLQLKKKKKKGKNFLCFRTSFSANTNLKESDLIQVERIKKVEWVAAQSGSFEVKLFFSILSDRGNHPFP